MTQDEKEDVDTKIMEALEDNFDKHEEKVASLLETHKKAVNCEEDDNVEGQDSMDVDVKESEEEIEKEAVAAKKAAGDKAGIAAGKVENVNRGVRGTAESLVEEAAGAEIDK